MGLVYSPIYIYITIKKQSSLHVGKLTSPILWAWYLSPKGCHPWWHPSAGLRPQLFGTCREVSPQNAGEEIVREVLNPRILRRISGLGILDYSNLAQI